MSRLAKALGAALVVALFAAAPAQAKFGLKDFSFTFTNEDGSAARLAGSHPFEVNATFNVNTKTDPETAEQVPDGDPKALHFQLPPGFIGSTTAVPRCATADFLTVDIAGYPACPNATAVGATQTQIQHLGPSLLEPVYNLVPPPGVGAKIGFISFNIPVTVEIGVNGEAPNNLVSGVLNALQVVDIFGTSLQIWGIPAAHSHDPFRGRCLETGSVAAYGELLSNGICNTGAAEVPFLTLPRSCTGPLTSSYEAISWQEPDAVPDKGSFEAPGMTGCSNLGFSPGVTAKPTSSSAESASGLDFGIDINNEGLTNPTGLSQSDVKDLVVRMPAGMTLNPSAASGLSTCSKAGYEAESLATPPGEGCPQASKIGELEVETPILAKGEVIRGSAFLASQDDNPFASLLAFYVVFKDPELGILVKRAVKVEPNEEQGPNAGRIVTIANDFPQVPISHLRFRFNEGARAPLVTPPACGTYTTEAQFTPWADPGNPRLSIPATFNVTSGVAAGPCPPGGVPPFHPGFEAGSINNSAGAYSPFSLRLTRSDGEQDLTRFDAVLPPGVLGKIVGVSKCSDAAIEAAKSRSGRQELAAPSCPANSQVGRVLGGAGVGSVLTYVPGKLYLAGPFGGDPLSVVSIVPAVAGPFDVGTVVTRVALTVNPDTYLAEVDGAHSDPIPHILKGIPLKLRDLRAYADRPNFILNATSCDEEKAKVTMFGSFLDVFNPADDVPVSRTARYQAASCASLKFKPKLSLALSGGTKRGDHPALKSVITYPRGGGYSNIGKAAVTLPPSEFIDNAHIQNPCTRVQFNANRCPKGSILGTARATTPLLDEPLEGLVYFRSNGGERLLPDVVIDLHGLFHVTLVGHVDSVNARVRTIFEKAPDAPVSKFTLNLKGGKKGLFVNNRNLCAHKVRAIVDLTAQSGRLQKTQPVVKTSCGKAKRRK